MPAGTFDNAPERLTGNEHQFLEYCLDVGADERHEAILKRLQERSLEFGTAREPTWHRAVPHLRADQRR